uniref:Uncharacterized protein LOC111101474 n=1 Tax=Crassostrea virginica TaxID=6565 RepID=A0A8B8AET8_CRAVI|nr:uncharacterized protein LOC111101474 [Crassostrea virginica]
MNHTSYSSEGMYVLMCWEVGSPTEVRIRRELADTSAVVTRPLMIMRGLERVMGGSLREGFRIKGCDMDWMLWLPNHKVICDISQITLYHIPEHTVILMECENVSPGSTRLKMLTPSGYPEVYSSSTLINGESYISVSFFRKHFLNFTKRNVAFGCSSTEHGPCATYTISGLLEMDRAYCFRSNHWPCVALPWIWRCQHKNWPSGSVLSAIVKEGCHVVPVNSDPLDQERDSEWRISFAVAELKLVYSMNHCQFICYGMLKIFLKEVINADDDDPCLSSYYIKTVLFWVVQNDRLIAWTPCNLLLCFWNCLKLLISWVYRGECPNFFIPQNNMFRVKVFGHKQAALFEKLYALYSKGISCLLLSPTVGKHLEKSTLHRTLTPSTEESKIIPDFLLDVCLFEEINRMLDLIVNNEEEFRCACIALEQFKKGRLTLFQKITTQSLLSKLHRNFCFMPTPNKAMSNRTCNNLYKERLNAMKLAVKIGCVSEIVYLAMYYYKNCHYVALLNCLQKAKRRLSRPYVVYYRHTDEVKYIRSMKGVSLSDKMNKCCICDIILCDEYHYTNALVPEQIANKTDGNAFLSIPPLVILHMLFVLNHHRLGDTVRSQQFLQDLHTLLLFDDGTRVPEHLRDISWQILGICQQTCGDYVGAFMSFQCSLQEFPFNCIRLASSIRILTILGCLLRKY